MELEQIETLHTGVRRPMQQGPEAVVASEYFSALSDVLARIQVSNTLGRPLDLDEGARSAATLLARTRETGGQVLLVGNGGSASIAGHMLMDLSNSGYVKALSFHDAPQLTALANDYGYVAAFERCIRLWAQPGDLLVAISSSGRSENILRAARAASEMGCQVLTFSGFAENNPLRSLGNLNFYAPSSSYGYVEMAHSVLGHFLTDCVRKR